MNEYAGKMAVVTAKAALFLASAATFSAAVKLPEDGGLGRGIEAPQL